MDVYVTGSNSKFLSKDIITEFRDRGDEIHVKVKHDANGITTMSIYDFLLQENSLEL